MYKQRIKSDFIFIGSEKFTFDKTCDLYSARDARKVMSETRPCDCCKSSFKVITTFENLSGKQFYSSSQTLFKLSQREDSFEIVLAKVCRKLDWFLGVPKHGAISEYPATFKVHYSEQKKKKKKKKNWHKQREENTELLQHKPQLESGAKR